jgi:hypothetical protein
MSEPAPEIVLISEAIDRRQLADRLIGRGEPLP